MSSAPQEATTQEVVATVMFVALESSICLRSPSNVTCSIYTTVTTCPVTKTHTIGTSSSLEVTDTVSTIYRTVTSTICTKCIPPPTAVPSPAASSYTQQVASITAGNREATSTMVYYTVSESNTPVVVASPSTPLETVVYHTATESNTPVVVAFPSTSLETVVYHTVTESNTPVLVASPSTFLETMVYHTVTESNTPVLVSSAPTPLETLHNTLYNTVYNTVTASTSSSIPYLPNIEMPTTVSSYVPTTVVGVVTKTIVPVLDTSAAVISASSQSVAQLYSSVTVSVVPSPSPSVRNSTSTPSMRIGATASASGPVSAFSTTPKPFEGAATRMGGMRAGFLVLLAVVIVVLL